MARIEIQASEGAYTFTYRRDDWLRVGGELIQRKPELSIERGWLWPSRRVIPVSCIRRFALDDRTLKIHFDSGQNQMEQLALPIGDCPSDGFKWIFWQVLRDIRNAHVESKDTIAHAEQTVAELAVRAKSQSRGFAGLSPKHRSELLRIRTLYGTGGLLAPRDVLVEMAHPLRPERPTVSSLLSQLSHSVADLCLFDRFLEDRVDSLVHGISLSARLIYLSWIANRAPDQEHYGCVYDLYGSLAVNDEPAIRAFVQRFPTPGDHGHPFTLSLYRAVFSLLRGEKHSLDEHIPSLLNVDPGNLFMTAVRDCVIGILRSAPADIVTALQAMLRTFGRQNAMLNYHDGLWKLFCLPAHAMYRLACRHLDANVIDLSDISGMRGWDAAFADATSVGEYRYDRLRFGLDEAAPVIQEWIVGLPMNIDLTRLERR